MDVASAPPLQQGAAASADAEQSDSKLQMQSLHTSYMFTYVIPKKCPLFASGSAAIAAVC